LPTSRDGVEPTQDIELVTKDTEPSGQRVDTRRPVTTSNGGEAVCDRIIAEDATGHGIDAGLRSTHAVDVICPEVV